MEVKGDLSVVQDLYADKGFIEFDETDSITTPPSGSVRIYFKGGRDTIYAVSSDGTEGPLQAMGAVAISVEEYFHGRNIGNVMYLSGSVSGVPTWGLANASDANTLGIGIVSKVVDEHNYKIAIAGPVEEGLSGLIPMQWYYTSDETDGAYIPYESAISNPIFQAITSEIAMVIPYRPAESGLGGEAIYDNEFVATSGQVDFVLSGTPYSKDYLITWIDGLNQADSTYSLSGNIVTFTSGLDADQLVKFRIFIDTDFNYGLGRYLSRDEPSIPDTESRSLGTASASYEIFEEANPKLNVNVLFTAGDNDPHVMYPTGEDVGTTVDTSGCLNIYVASNELMIQNNLGAGEKTFSVYKKT